MYLIVGLGNPEEEYGSTRHNMGFDVINILSKMCNIGLDKKKFKGILGSGEIENNKVILLKPQTYMNLSGQSIREVLNFYKIQIENLIVIYDDIDLDVGKVKIRKAGGSGTHNGMKSVITSIGTQNFTRIRVGIGKPENKERLIEHVLGAISEEEKKELESAVKIASLGIIEILKNGIETAMNKIN